ncbi:hypothetical protein [Pseudoxanthomonas suwonensis]|jgi:hypothetical protein|uniref:hypothetical protein n=1 Tax=Pseudoxanthomonas suwonensis TaxID=314722 RepID=UPI0004B78398|nr:hypothetical protein [Pseudoxanthomonas suwonensis]
MRTLMLATALVAFAGITACDRRDDQDMDRTGAVTDTPAEVVDPATTTPATTDPATPPGTLPPTTNGTTDPACVGREGTEGCPEVQDERVPTDPEPTTTPPSLKGS